MIETRRLKNVAAFFQISRYLKMSSFCAVNYSSCAGREKDKPNYRFFKIVKKNSKKTLKLSKVRRKKSLAQIFRKDLTLRGS